MVASSRSSSAGSSPDPHGEAWNRVERAILGADGVLPHYVRRGIARGDDPPELALLLAKVRREAYRIEDGDVAPFDADTVIEAALAAALAEADRRRVAALKAIG